MSPIRGSGAQINDPMVVARILSEVSNYHMHGSFYTHDNGLTVSLPTAGSPVVSTGWTANVHTGAGYVVVDAPNGTITIGDKGAGLYDIIFTASFQSSRNNVLIHAAVYLNGGKLNMVAAERSIGTANATGDFTGVNDVLLAPGDVLDFRWEANVNTTTISVTHGAVRIKKTSGEV